MTIPIVLVILAGALCVGVQVGCLIFETLHLEDQAEPEAVVVEESSWEDRP